MARLRVEYEVVEPVPLKFIETAGVPKNKPTGQKSGRNPHVQSTCGAPHPQDTNTPYPAVNGWATEKNKPTARNRTVTTGW